MQIDKEELEERLSWPAAAGVEAMHTLEGDVD
jgi:hypothetical protein